MSDSARPRILIVDDSRIVRATIIKRVRDRFDVREEVDGEAGWEALLIDPTLQLVVTDHTMPRLDGYGLIERIRASRVGRIRDIPVIMISGDEDEESRQRAKDLGATDFITKGTGAAELLARLDSLVDLGRAHEALEEARADSLTDPDTGLLTPGALLKQAFHIFSFARRHGTPAGALVIGIDRFEALAEEVGRPVADELLKRFAALLASFVRKEDALGRWHGNRFAVVTPGVDAQHAALFAERLRGAIAGASIEHAGRSLPVTMTAGISSCPADGDQAEALLTAAEQRLAAGMTAGGDRVAAGAIDAAASGASIDEALAHLAAGRQEAVRGQLPALAWRLLPLLGMLARELDVDLPLDAVERRLSARVASETVSTT